MYVVDVVEQLLVFGGRRIHHALPPDVVGQTGESVQVSTGGLELVLPAGLRFTFIGQARSRINLLADAGVDGRRPRHWVAACCGSSLLFLNECRSFLLVLLHDLGDVLFNLCIYFVGGEVIGVDLELQLEGLRLGNGLLVRRSGLGLGLFLKGLQLLLLLPIECALLLWQLQFLGLYQLVQWLTVGHWPARFDALSEDRGEVSLRCHLRLTRHEHRIWIRYAILERIIQRLLYIKIGGELLLISIELLESKLAIILLFT